jgi:hypothetical protein
MVIMAGSCAKSGDDNKHISTKRTDLVFISFLGFDSQSMPERIDNQLLAEVLL